MDAVWQHMGLQTSVHIKILPKGFPVFQLQLQIPYFVARPMPKKPTNSKIPRECMDLSFLRIPPYMCLGNSKYGAFEAAFSLVLCGKHDLHWVAYAFDDTYFNEEEGGEEEEEEDEEEEEPQAPEDPIAPNGKVLVDPPLWNAREYFLTICDHRMTQVFEESQSLVRIIQYNVAPYTKHDSSTPVQHSENRRYQTKNVEETLERNVKTIELLTQLHNRISRTVRAWETFYSYDGDIAYFQDFDLRSSDRSSRLVYGSLLAIRETLAKLKDLEQDVLLLKQSCLGSTDALNLRLSLESTEEARRSNKAAQESQKVARESNEVARKSGQVAEESQKIAQESNEVARKNGQVAAFTVWVISPSTIALALSQLPQDVVPFKQSSASLIIATLILMAVMRLALTLNGALPGPLWHLKKIRAWMTRSDNRDGNEYELP